MPIRVRLVLFFTIGSMLAMALGGWYFVVQLRSGLVYSLDANIATQWSLDAQSIAGQEGSQDGGGNGPGGLLAQLPTVSGGTEYLVQLINRSGRLVASNSAGGSVSMLDVAPFPSTANPLRVTTVSTRESERIRIRAAPLGSSSPYVLLVGVSLDGTNATIATVQRDLIFAGIVVVGVSAMGAFLLATGALSPVERLRRQVSALSDRDESVSVEVPRTRDEIAALARTMNELLGRLHEALVKQRSFVADAGHELRTPFAILQGELELAARPGRSTEELKDAISRAADETERLFRLAEDLLLLARGDQAAPELSMERTRVSSVVEGAAGLVATRAEAAGVAIRIEVPYALEIDCDPIRIRQAIDNLVENALRFAPRHTGIVLRATHVDHRTEISVVDRGPGFPEEFLPHAFERFRRPDDARSRQDGGSGLGLAIVSAIASWHQGAAFARNRAGGGAEVGFEIPDLAVFEPEMPRP